MIRPLHFQLLALALAQTFSVGSLAGPVPSGQLTLPAVLPTVALKYSPRIDGTAMSNAGKTPAISINSPDEQAVDAQEPHSNQRQDATEKLVLKLDTILGKPRLADYDRAGMSDFSFVSNEFSGDLASSNMGSDWVESGATSAPLSPWASAADKTSKRSFSPPEELSQLGRTRQSDLTSVNAATESMTAELMGYLDAFSKKEFTDDTLRAPIIVDLGAGTSKNQPVLYLLPDARGSVLNDIASDADLPEPGTIILLAASFFALYVARRRIM